MPRWALFGLIAFIAILAAYALTTSLVFCGYCIAPMSGQAAVEVAAPSWLV